MSPKENKMDDPWTLLCRDMTVMVPLAMDDQRAEELFDKISAAWEEMEAKVRALDPAIQVEVGRYIAIGE
jgi:hypothetical protein